VKETITDRSEILKRTFDKVDGRPGLLFFAARTLSMVPDESLTVVYPVKEEFLIWPVPSKGVLFVRLRIIPLAIYATC
jgi:hypothetical protein